jgi:hypothetical protein
MQREDNVTSEDERIREGTRVRSTHLGASGIAIPGDLLMEGNFIVQTP